MTHLNLVSNAKPLLTDRELQILRLIGTGASSASVAKELHLARKTISNNLYAIYRKLHVTNRTQAVLTAIKLQLIDLDLSPVTAAGAHTEGGRTNALDARLSPAVQYPHPLESNHGARAV